MRMSLVTMASRRFSSSRLAARNSSATSSTTTTTGTGRTLSGSPHTSEVRTASGPATEVRPIWRNRASISSSRASRSAFARSGVSASADSRGAKGASSTPHLQSIPTSTTGCRARPHTRLRRYTDLPDCVAPRISSCGTVRKSRTYQCPSSRRASGRESGPPPWCHRRRCRTSASTSQPISRSSSRPGLVGRMCTACAAQACRRRSAEAMKSSGACPVAMRSRITRPDPVGSGRDRRGGTGAASRPTSRAVARRTAEAGTVRPQASIVVR